MLFSVFILYKIDYEFNSGYFKTLQVKIGANNVLFNMMEYCHEEFLRVPQFVSTRFKRAGQPQIPSG